MNVVIIGSRVNGEQNINFYILIFKIRTNGRMKMVESALDSPNLQLSQ
jgi:hypothetical protein